jgi:hypothetical protein
MPFFAEVPGTGLGSSFDVPQRYQVIVSALLALLRSAVPVFKAVNFSKVALWLETQLGAIDMGWRIDPVGAGSEFDFTQGVIPLRKILNVLSKGLEDECRRRGLDYPLAGTDLYGIFRAVKEQSYTEALVLQSPLGRNGGAIKTSTLYGPPNSGNVPIMMLQKNDKHITGKLREAVSLSQIKEVENPYDLSLIFK